MDLPERITGEKAAIWYKKHLADENGSFIMETILQAMWMSGVSAALTRNN